MAIRRGSESMRLAPGNSLEYVLMTDVPLRDADLHRLAIEPSRELTQQLLRRRGAKDLNLCLRNRQAKEWDEIQWTLDPATQSAVRTRDLLVPQAYVNRRSGTIDIRIENLGSRAINVGDDSLTVTLDVEYRGEAGGRGNR